MRLYVLILSILCYCQTASGLTVSEALALARKNAPELAEPEHLHQQALAKAASVNSAFDTTLFGEYRYADDRLQVTNTFAGEERMQRRLEVGARKLFGTGTSVELRALHEASETLFPPTNNAAGTADPATGASVQAQAQPGPGASALRYNPAYETRAEITLQQELWRNYGAQEVELERSVASGAAAIPKLNLLSAAQLVQSETEQLYWLATSLREQLVIATEIAERAQEFSEQMSRQVNIGRADSVDEADAQANLVSQETVKLQTEINLQKALRRLALRLQPTGDIELQPKDLSTPLTAVAHRLPKAEQVFEQASAQRAELRSLDQQIKIAELKRSLADEAGKPRLAAYAAGQQNGIAENRTDSFSEASKLRHPAYAIGVKFEMPLGNTRSANEIIAAVEESAAVNAKKSVALRDLRRGLNLAYLDLEGARLLLQQAEKKIQTFERKRQQELVKLRQARSDRISVIRYEMEVLMAQNERVSALKQLRDAEAEIQFLTHGYPSPDN